MIVLIEGIYEEETIPFAELEDDIRYQLEELLADNINEFMIHKDYIPEGKDLQDIADWVLKETNAAFYLKVVPNDAYRKLIDDTVRKLVREWKDDGMEIKDLYRIAYGHGNRTAYNQKNHPKGHGCITRPYEQAGSHVRMGTRI